SFACASGLSVYCPTSLTRKRRKRCLWPAAEKSINIARNGRLVRISLPPSWRRVLGGELKQPYFKVLSEFVDSERERYEVAPPGRDCFTAYKFTPYDRVRVVLLGQDPYHDEGQAHGLCFSVRPGVRKPPSLINILKELHGDVGCPIPNHGCLESWARQGVFMLNVVLTV